MSGFKPIFTRSPRRRGRASQRDRQAERLCGPEIDDELEFRRLLYREIGDLFALENACCKQTSLAVGIEQARSIACQAADIDEFAPLIYRRPPVAGSKHDYLTSLTTEERIGSDQKTRDGPLRETRECRVDLLHRARISQNQLAPKGSGRSFDALDLYLSIGPAWVYASSCN
jgi:hypothetical protein